jgi:DNA (cytosine-5)-methyltransferase 1
MDVIRGARRAARPSPANTSPNHHRGRRGLPLISLFSGALGLDLGLEEAGFEVRVAVECNRDAAETIRRNRPDIPLMERRLEEVTTAEILETAGLGPGEPVVVAGGPSCQSFSTAGQRGSLADPRGVMFREFLRVVKEARPRFFIMENVTGVLSAAVRHRPLKERGPGYPPLDPDEELGSAFALILKELKKTGYYVMFDLLNAADFGVAQRRERLVFLGSRDGEGLEMPERTHARVKENGRPAWVTLRRALRGLKDPEPVYTDLVPSKRKYLELIPEGGNWRDLPRRRQRHAVGAAYRSWGGRSGFLRRLAWDRPAPTLTSRPDSSATLLCHPTELRVLSIRECARLQQFPDRWEFAGARPQQYVQVGNAVPLGVGRAIGEALRKTMRKRSKADRLEWTARRKTVACAREELLERLTKRPRTVLNPSRMRKVKDPGAVTEWRNGRSRHRDDVAKLVSVANGG